MINLISNKAIIIIIIIIIISIINIPIINIRIRIKIRIRMLKKFQKQEATSLACILRVNCETQTGVPVTAGTES